MNKILDNYRISEDGLITRIKSGPGAKVGRILKHKVDKAGYHNVALSVSGKVKHFLVHRLVAMTHIPNPNNLPHVNHIDGDKNNNHFRNLEWCTPLENEMHAIEFLGKESMKGSMHGNSKLTESDIPKIRALREQGLLQREIADRFGICQQEVSDIILGKIWKHVA